MRWSRRAGRAGAHLGAGALPDALGPHEAEQQAKRAGAAVLPYGAFLQAVVDFLIVAFAIFIVVRQINKLRGPKT